MNYCDCNHVSNINSKFKTNVCKSGHCDDKLPQYGTTASVSSSKTPCNFHKKIILGLISLKTKTKGH